MKLYYDPDVDALYLRLADVTVTDSEEVRPGVILDFDDQDRVVQFNEGKKLDVHDAVVIACRAVVRPHAHNRIELRRLP